MSQRDKFPVPSRPSQSFLSSFPMRRKRKWHRRKSVIKSRKVEKGSVEIYEQETTFEQQDRDKLIR